MANTLYYGDNLEVLRKYIPSESVDLVYLDPPFNSKRDYNVLFAEQSGEPAESQVKAFTDSWKWSEHAFAELLLSETCRIDKVVSLVEGLVSTIGRNDVTAYIVMMAPRLVEMHRVLKRTGSLYLHCDPSASHYLKLVLDAVFGPANFRNEIIWKRKAGRGETNNAAIRFGVSTDTLLFYAKSAPSFFVRQHRKNNDHYLSTKFVHTDENGRIYRLDNLTSPSYRPNLVYEYKGIKPPPKGWAVSRDRMEEMDAEGRLFIPQDSSRRIQRKRYLDELEGETVDSLWDDIPPINSQAAERLGYPTQKPVALLKRVISASSNLGDTVLDPFCGCGTAIDASEKLGRAWIGIDITSVAITLIKSRIADVFEDNPPRYDIIGEPVSEADAFALAAKDKYEFQKWAIGLVRRAYPYQDQKGADGGIDGVVRFIDNPHEKAKRCIIQVKGGHIGVKDIRDLNGTMQREKATLGLFICVQQPTAPMITEAGAVGFYTTPLGNRRIGKLQIRTVGQLLAGETFDMPGAPVGIKYAAASEAPDLQEELEL